MSDVIKLLDLVWKNANSATDHSWERLNHSMRDALSLAIGSGFKWSLGDFEKIAGKYSFGYWCGDSVEWMYAEAIAVENMSACLSFEAWKKREPFIADSVRFHSYGGYTHGNSINRNKARLAVGFEFQWHGQSVKVTSFADGYLTACSYKRVKTAGRQYEREKIDRRFKITREDIFSERAERKERGELLERLTAAASGSETKAAEITKALGAKNKQAFAVLPIEKIRKVAEKYAKAGAA